MQISRLSTPVRAFFRNFAGGRIFRLRPVVSFILISLFTCTIATSWMPIATGQIPIPLPSEQSLSPPPYDVQRLGSLEVAPVNFEGVELFKIASPSVPDRSKPGNLIPVEQRAQQIQANLRRLIQNTVSISSQGETITNSYDPKTLQVGVAVLNGETIIQVKDNDHPQPLKVMTVTPSDANYYGSPIGQVAEYMRSRIDSEVRNSLKERSSSNLKKLIQEAVLLLLKIAAISFILWLLQRLLKHREKVLTARLEAETPVSDKSPLSSNTSSPALGSLMADRSGSENSVSSRPIGSPTTRRPTTGSPTTGEAGQISQRLAFLDAFRQQFSLRQRRRIVSFLRWLTSWGQAILWVGGTALILRLFPWTRALSAQLLRIPIQLLGIWFFTGLLIRLGDILLDRLAKVWDRYDIFGEGDAQREALRISTTVQALKGLKTFIVCIVGMTWALGVLGLPVGSVLAIGGIVAFAISLGFQNVVKDVVNGFLILMEDQYAIGDIIMIGTEAGLVENMNLRITQLRNGEGQLITVPNSSIIQVKNLTRTWSRVDFSIEVAYDTDIDRALHILQEVAQAMYEEPEWHDLFAGPPEVLGVDSISHTGMLIRVWLKTQPAQQWSVGREFRRRVRVAFDKNEVEIGKPQQDFWQKIEEPLHNGSADGQEAEELEGKRP
ncbi:mechanosensitive ion channel family protein [Kovacikia minuta CCNUW1]|uniref:mechanosensitive ion channel family protein n=1 Tax=Kovacikia minuta TaxID=2931930 RepID=UPI001CCA069C|nr:mechanosensitive ion channel family protein [Kovacikia minuta]UBF24104.1 mechanosensitive ion channel family protein [Kovacikia minuta CCNUW1]